jgi:hypothetical protein
VAKFKLVGRPVTNNCIHKEIKRILNSGKTSEHSVQNLVFHLLSENKYKTITISHFVWM